MSDAPISLIVLEPVIDSMASLIRVLEKSPQLELIAVPSAEEAHQVALQFQPCVILISIRGSLDGNTQVDLLKKLEKPIRSGQVKPLVISTVKKHPLAVAISTIGVKDYVEEPTTTKSLLFKMNLFFKAINAQKAKSSKNKNEETTVFKAKPQEEQKESLVVGKNSNATYKPALQLAEDTFVFKGSLPRKINNKLMLEAEGPSPETGIWTELSTKVGELQKWKWIPKSTAVEEGIPPQAEDSGWVYEGDKPTYNIRNGKWQMRSPKPRLDFYKKAKPIANKVETDEKGEVSIAEDSQAAKDNLMLNKTLVSQAQEEQLKKAILEQEEEELKKIMVIEKRMPQKQRGRDAAFEEDDGVDEKDRSELEKRIREKKNADRNKDSTQEETDSIEWSSKISSDLPESSLLKKSPSASEETKTRELNRTEASNADDIASAANLELKTKEEKLQGLKEDDLTGEQNLRDKMRDDFSISVNPDNELEGLSEEGLDNGLDSKERPRSTKSLSTQEEAGGAVVGDHSALEKNQFGARRTQRQKKELASTRPKREKLSKEKLGKLAREKIQAILALMAVEEGEEQKKSELEPLDEEQVNSLRKQLGIADEEPLTRQELERRAREEKKKRRQKEIKALEDAISGGITSLESIFFAEEPNDWNEEELSAEERERNFRAIESAEEDFSVEDSSLAKLDKTDKELKNKNSVSSGYFYLNQEEVQPEDGRWICEEEKWIYLSADIFKVGFDKLEDLLPTWIFEGSEEPKLLLAERKWRFLGSAPYSVESPVEISFALKDQLQAYSKSKFDREKRRAARDLADNKAAEASNKHSELLDEEISESTDGIVGEDNLLRLGNRAPLQVEESEADSIGKVREVLPDSAEDSGLVKELRADRDRLGEVEETLPKEEEDSGSIHAEEEALKKAGFGKAHLEEMLSGELGGVTVLDDTNSKQYFIESAEAKVHNERYTIKELLVFVKINDVKSRLNSLEKEIVTILKLMHLAHPQLNFEYVKDTGPLELIDKSDTICAIGNLFVTTSSASGRFSDRERFIIESFAKALALLVGPSFAEEQSAAA